MSENDIYMERCRLEVSMDSLLYSLVERSGLDRREIAARTGWPESRVNRLLDRTCQDFDMESLIAFGLACGVRFQVYATKHDDSEAIVAGQLSLMEKLR